MPAIDVTDMRDFVSDPLVQLTPQMAKRRAFLGGIVRAATATPLAKSVSGIPCRRRPGNRPCLGSIAVRRTDLPERSIFWECTACGDAGRIAGFQDGPDDLSAAAELSLGHTGKRRTVVVTAQEYSSWISGDLIAYDIESMQILYSAIASSRGIRISALQDELGALLDATSADANHEPNRKRRAHLDSICDKLAGVRRMPKKRRSRSITAAEPAYAHGFFSALVAGPLVTPSRWLERFITEEPESIEEFSAHAERIMNTCNEVAEALLQRRERFGDETLAIAGMGAHGDALIDWHQGFLDAMDLSPDEWTDFLATQPKELFGPLALIAQCAADPSKRSWLHERDVRENTAFALGIMTARLWEAYRDQPFVRLESAHETVRRADPKVSRNAPCPCGSGKKYKLCCGSTLRSV